MALDENQVNTKKESLLLRLSNMYKHKGEEKTTKEDSTEKVIPEENINETSNVDALDIMDVTENYLHRLRCNVIGAECLNAEDVDYSTFMYEGKITDEQKEWFKELQNQSKILLQVSSMINDDGQLMNLPQDASYKVMITKGSLSAWIFVFPPFNEGKPIDEAALRLELSNKNITYGIIDNVIKEIVDKQIYLKLIMIAEGAPAINGENGEIVDHFPRENNIALEYDEEDNVDYKNLNWLHQIKSGDIICDIIPATEAVEGMTVNGKTLLGRSGMRAKAPQGKETVLSEDGTKLLAKMDGQIFFSGGKFNVEKVVNIRGNVDHSVGNLNVVGDVVISGDVLEGFTVKATGNVIVMGTIEGASIYAGGNIQIHKGMNGNYHGTLEAGGDVVSKFLENCEVYAVGSVRSDSIINTNVASDDKVIVKSDKGIIIGGTISAATSVEAKVVGNKSNRTTIIQLGSSRSLIKQKAQLELEVDELKSSIEDGEKNIAFLQKQTVLPEKYKMLLDQLKLQVPMQKIKLAGKMKALEDIRKKEDYSGCFVKAATIYPITNISIGNETISVKTISHQYHVYRTTAGIKIGVM